MNDSNLHAQLLDLNKRLLDCISSADWSTYQELCDQSLTAFEPEAIGQLVEGMEFHHFYFENGGQPGPANTTMCSPHVRVMGNVALVCYVRVVQQMKDDGPVTIGFEETRVWENQDGNWKHVHFHRSRIGQQWPAIQQ